MQPYERKQTSVFLSLHLPASSLFTVCRRALDRSLSIPARTVADRPIWGDRVRQVLIDPTRPGRDCCRGPAVHIPLASVSPGSQSSTTGRGDSPVLVPGCPQFSHVRSDALDSRCFWEACPDVQYVATAFFLAVRELLRVVWLFSRPLDYRSINSACFRTQICRTFRFSPTF